MRTLFSQNLQYHGQRRKEILSSRVSSRRNITSVQLFPFFCFRLKGIVMLHFYNKFSPLYTSESDTNQITLLKLFFANVRIDFERKINLRWFCVFVNIVSQFPTQRPAHFPFIVVTLPLTIDKAFWWLNMSSYTKIIWVLSSIDYFLCSLHSEREF